MYVSSTIISHLYLFPYIFLGFCVYINHNTQPLECRTPYLKPLFVLIFRDLLGFKSNYRSRSKGGVRGWVPRRIARGFWKSNLIIFKNSIYSISRSKGITYSPLHDFKIEILKTLLLNSPNQTVYEAKFMVIIMHGNSL